VYNTPRETEPVSNPGVFEEVEDKMLQDVNIRSSVAVYVQIENSVQFAIASGRLKAGDQLPSIRELSERLKVNPNTVVKAYRDLEVMGLVYSRRGMGVFITKKIPSTCGQQVRQHIIEKMCEVVAEAKAAGMTLAGIKEVAGKSYASDTGLYGETPSSLLALAKTRKRA
jgi:GntR family transcriptional regulator